MKINRSLDLNTRRHHIRMIPSVDICMVNTTVIDEKGKIKTICQRVVDDTVEKLDSIPAYTCKVEYMRLMGTLNNLHEIHQPAIHSGVFSEHDIQRAALNIVRNNIATIGAPNNDEIKDNENVEQPKNDE